MYKLIISELADSDLNDIISYIAVTLANPNAAARLLNGIEKCYDFLKTMPEMYALCQDPILEAKGYRKAIIDNYILIYQIDKLQKIVTIYRIFYGGRDYAKLI